MQASLSHQTTVPQPESRRNRLDALTGLRFVAALFVFFAHFQERFHVRFGNSAYLADISVSFFFVLSGFILTHAYSGRIGPGQRARYFVSRFARIWPIYLVSIGICILVTPAALLSAPGHGPAQLLPYLALVQSWSTDLENIIYVNGAAWSLSVEAFLYLVFPFLCVLTPRQFRWTFIAIAVLTGVALFVGERLWDQAIVGQAALTTLCRFSPPLRLFEFATGIAAARFATRRANPTTKSPVRDSAMDFLCIALLALSFETFGPDGWISGLIPPQTAPLTVQYLGIGGGYALPIAIAVIWFARSSGVIAWLLSRPLSVFLGEISFAVFLVHTPLQIWAMNSVLIDLKDWRIPLALSVAATLAAATLLHRWVEVPARDLIVAAWERKLPAQWPAIRTGLFSMRRNIPVVGSVLILIATPAQVRKIGADRANAEFAGHVQSTPAELRNVVFANEAEIVAAHTVETGKSVELTIVYRMLPGARRDLKVHATDLDGNIVRQFSTRLSSFQQPDGRVLTVARTTCNSSDLRGASSLGIVFWKKGLGTAVPDRGPRTMNGRRLEVFPLPTALSEAQPVSDDDASLGDG